MDSIGSRLAIPAHFCERGIILWGYKEQRISLLGENLQGLRIQQAQWYQERTLKISTLMRLQTANCQTPSVLPSTPIFLSDYPISTFVTNRPTIWQLCWLLLVKN
jgi:hypothetical protein